MYDGKHLLIVQFKAKNVEDIKSANCAVDCCILARTPDNPNECAARYALYRLVWRGWMRMTGKNSENIPLSLAGWDRKFHYWSGEPFWENQQIHTQEMMHPNGYVRLFSTAAKRWYWVDIAQNTV